MMNEIFLDDLKKRTIRGQLGQKQRGFFVAEKAFGYKSEPAGNIIIDKKGRSRPEGYKMVIVDHEADIIKQIFQMCADGIPVTRIVKELNQKEVPSSKSAKNGWNVSSVSRILRNEKYIGIWAWGKLQNKRHPLTGIIIQEPRKEGPLFTGNHVELRIIP